MSESRVITVNLPAQAAMQNKAAGVLATVEAMEIDSDSMLAVAGEELVGLKRRYKDLEELRQVHVKPLNEEVKYINNHFRGALACMEQAEGALKRKMLTYQNEQEAKRREAQARIEAQQCAERARIAERAKDEADPQQRAADEITALVMTAPVLSSAPKLAGISTKGVYKGKVTDLLALCRYIVAHPEHVNLVKGDDTAINKIARAQRDACNIEGILVYEEQSLAVRSA